MNVSLPLQTADMIPTRLAYPREPMCREGRDEMVPTRVPTVPMPKEAAGHWWHPGKLTLDLTGSPQLGGRIESHWPLV